MALAPLLATAVLAAAPPPLPEQLLAPTEFQALIYCATPALTPTKAEVRKRAGAHFPLVRPDAGKPKPSRAQLVVNTATVEEFPPPSAELLPYMQILLTDAELKVVPGLRGVVGVTLVDGRGDPARGVAEMNALLAALAAPHGCFIKDHAARLITSVSGWRTRSAQLDPRAPRLSLQINRHVYTNGLLQRIVTLGMAKFGLPDVAIDQFAAPSSERMGILVDWICDSLVAGRLRPGGWLTLGPTPQGARTTGKAEVRLRLDERQEGDNENRLITVDFSGEPGASLQERQSALLTRLLGAPPDLKRGAPAGDPELLAASARARARWPGVAARFARGLPFPQKLNIKRAFVMPGGKTEYMWISVTRRHGDLTEGVLINDAFDPAGPRAGLHVTSRDSDVYDYSIWSEGKELEGGETELILEARRSRGD